MTRSTAPMSMPSSSDDVATTARNSPPLSAASISSLCSLDTEPWWARASSSPARLLIPLQMRSASRRELAKTRSEEHTSELQSRPHLVCRLLLEKKKSFVQLEASDSLSRTLAPHPA